MWHLPTLVFVPSIHINTHEYCYYTSFSIVVSLSLYDDVDCIRMGEKQNNKTLSEYFFFRTLERVSKIPLLCICYIFF